MMLRIFVGRLVCLNVFVMMVLLERVVWILGLWIILFFSVIEGVIVFIDKFIGKLNGEIDEMILSGRW